MERKSNFQIIDKREAFRLWFEYLKLAALSKNLVVKDTLNESRSFYEPWGDISHIKFDDWWISHAHLFEEKYSVRALASGEPPLRPTFWNG